MKNSLSKSNYFVEFKRFVFIDEQFKKFDSFIDNVFENCLFVAIYRMYFFFFFNLRNKILRCGFWYCRSSKRAQHDRRCENFCRIFSIDETRKKIKSKNFCFFHFARSQIRENLRSLFRDRKRQNYFLLSFDSWI